MTRTNWIQICASNLQLLSRAIGVRASRALAEMLYIEDSSLSPTTAAANEVSSWNRARRPA